MRTRCVPGLLLFAFTLTPARSATYRVSASPPGPAANGLTWATAFPTVQQALVAAESGDEVWVAAGTYQEGKTITLKSGVGLYGGFAGTETERSQRDPAANATVLDGEAKVTVVSIPASADSRTVLDGFTVRNGLAPNTTGKGGTGGGVYIGGGTPIVSNNTITLCGAEGARTVGSYGGGVYVEAGTPLIASNTITGNGAMFGGGIYANGGLIRDNTVANNSASHMVLEYGYGGGIALSNHAVAVHNVVTGNQASDAYGGGGGIFSVMAIVADNFVQGNQGTWATGIWGAAIDTIVRNTVIDDPFQYSYVVVKFQGGTCADNLVVCSGTLAYSSGLALETSTGIHNVVPLIANNTIVKAGQPIGYGVSSSYDLLERPVFSNNIVTGFQAASYSATYGPAVDPVFTTDHNDVYGNGDNALAFHGASQVGENGNISADPLFVDAAGGDYRLQAGSPCIDAGNDATVSSGDRDLLGAPRIAGAHVDIGCYEYGSPAWTMLDAAEVLKVAAGLSLSTPAEVSRLDVAAEDGATGPRLTVLDATRIARWLLN